VPEHSAHESAPTGDAGAPPSYDVNALGPQVSPAHTRVGWIGLGVMGSSMARHVLDAGYALSVHTRTPSRAQPLLDAGATWFDDPVALAEAVDVVCVMVGHPHEVDHVVGELIERCTSHVEIIDHTTSEPTLAAALSERAAAAGPGRGLAVYDAPVSGGDRGARDGTLSIMCGGDADGLFHLWPLLQTYGATIVHHGPAGAGQHAKVVNQTLVAGAMTSLCEALVYACAAGLDPDAVLRSVGGGAASSWTLTHLAPRMLDGDLAPGFYVEHFIKDLEITLHKCERMGLELPGVRLAHELYVALAERGHYRDGTQALIVEVARRNGLSWPPPRPTRHVPPEDPT
jgi:3-hydroxyisobutyrate dehydrogenase